jgi:hypothetical protein
MKRFDYLQDFEFAGHVAHTACIEVEELARDPE